MKYILLLLFSNILLFGNSLTLLDSYTDRWNNGALTSSKYVKDSSICTKYNNIGYVRFGLTAYTPDYTKDNNYVSFSFQPNKAYIYIGKYKYKTINQINDGDIYCIKRVDKTFDFTINNNSVYKKKKSSSSYNIYNSFFGRDDSIGCKLSNLTLNDKELLFSAPENVKIEESSSGEDLNISEVNINLLFGFSGILLSSFFLYRIS